MGTPEFAVTPLKTLVEQGYNIVGVVTAPDRPAGRGRKLQESAVKTYAKSQNLTVLQPTNLKDPEFSNTLQNLKVNLQIVVAFRMLPKVVWQLPEYGTFNLHASLLPNYRGAAPINWAIINGETETGVSTFFIDEKIDTGDMILQKAVAIEPQETAGSLHDKLMTLGSELILKTVELIAEGNVTTQPQKESENIEPAPKLDRDNTKIDWNANVDIIYNLIRGLSPYPAAWCTLNNDSELFDIKIYSAKKIKEHHNNAPGTIITTKKELQVAAKDGFIIIEQIKLPGKKLMDTISLLNGYSFSEDAKML